LKSNRYKSINQQIVRNIS